MSEHACIQCGKPVRQSSVDGLCPHCLLLQVLQPLDPPESGTPDDTQQRWIGPYVLLEEIARGGMGIVFRAKERDLGRVVALKLLRGAEWVAGTSLERFRTEARAAATLVHPHIVPVYSFGDDGGNWYIAMRLIEGGSLADWIRREAAPDRGSIRQREAQGRTASPWHRSRSGIILGAWTNSPGNTWPSSSSGVPPGLWMPLPAAAGF